MHASFGVVLPFKSSLLPGRPSAVTKPVPPAGPSVFRTRALCMAKVVVDSGEVLLFCFLFFFFK